MKATGMMMMTAAMALLVGSSLALALGPGGGPGHSGGQRGVFQFDENGDGQLTREEVASVRGDRFSMMDADEDGVLSQEEFEAGARALMEAWVLERFRAADSNGDGVVSEAEVLESLEDRAMPRMGRRFGWLDGDGDGSVTESEFTNIGDRMFQRWDREGDGVIDLSTLETDAGHRRGPHGGRHGARTDGDDQGGWLGPASD